MANNEDESLLENLKAPADLLTTEAGEKATQYRSVFTASFVSFVLACLRTLFTTCHP
jgi:hypothetical protein